MNGLGDGEDSAPAGGTERFQFARSFVHSRIHSFIHAHIQQVSQSASIPSLLSSLTHFEGNAQRRQGLHAQIAQMRVSFMKVKIFSGLLVSSRVF